MSWLGLLRGSQARRLPSRRLHFWHRFGERRPPHAPPPVVHFHRSVFVFTDQRLALRRTITARSGMQLQPESFMPDDPIVTDHALGLQAEDLAPFPRTPPEPV